MKRVDQAEAAAWADCADPLQNAIPGPDRVAVVVRVASDGNTKSKLHVQAGWSYSFDREVTCQSRGIWEQQLLAKIKDASEREARELGDG